MDKNVGSVDLEELKRAREELNRDMGIQTDPNMYDNYNPNRKAEESADLAESENSASENLNYEESLESEGEEETNAGLNLQDFSVQENENEQTADEAAQTEEPIQSVDDETSGEVDFSVYDNFAAFEVAENAGVSKKAEEAESTNTNTEQTKPTAETIEETPKQEDKLEEALESKENSNEEEAPHKKTQEEIDAENEENLRQLEALLGLAMEKQTVKTEAENSNTDEKPEEDTAKNSLEGSTDLQSETTLNNLQSEENNLDESKDEQIASIEPKEEPVSASEPKSEPVLEDLQPSMASSNSSQAESNEQSETDKFKNGFVQSEQDSELKIKNAIASLNSSKQSENASVAQKTELFKSIKSIDFVDVISSPEFENLDIHSYALGLSESGSYQFASLSAMYNVAIFSNNEKSSSKLLYSLMLSLMLKNNYNDIKFYIADTDVNSSFKKFVGSSYLAEKISTNYDETLDLLSKIIKEIDDRYEAIAGAGLKNVEEYNKAMAESYIIGYPISVLIFNNYKNLSNLETYNQIKDSLSYILKYGRLAGIYVYLVSKTEIIDEKINYNLATRIAFRADSAEDSFKQIGDSGAEKLAEEDEFVYKTIYSDDLMHIKVPNISDREVELLIENIER